MQREVEVPRVSELSLNCVLFAGCRREDGSITSDAQRFRLIDRCHRVDGKATPITRQARRRMQRALVLQGDGLAGAIAAQREEQTTAEDAPVRDDADLTRKWRTIAVPRTAERGGSIGERSDMAAGAVPE